MVQRCPSAAALYGWALGGGSGGLAFGSLEVLQCADLGDGGIKMLRYRLALVAAGIFLLTAPSAWAFSQGNAGSSGDGSSSFTDPDEQIMNNFGIRSNGESKLGVQQQQSTFDPIWWEQSLHGYGPYTAPTRPVGPGAGQSPSQ